MTEQEAFALVFHPGLTTADEISQVSGRGVGMNIVKTSVARQNGIISIDSEMHKGTTFTIRLPMALAVTRVLLVKAVEQIFAFPLKLVKHISRRAAVGSLWSGAGSQIPPAEDNRQTGENRNPKTIENESSIFHLNDLLGLPSAVSSDADTPFLLLKTSGMPSGLIIDEIIKPEEIVIKPLGNPLQNLKGFLGASILGDGSVVPVLDLLYLLDYRNSNADTPVSDQKLKTEKLKTQQQKPLHILIVDDSPSVRHLTSKTIKNAGWTATVAKDGLEALDILQDLRDLPAVILTDVEMPRMNGYELLASLKKQEHLQAIPVVMITSRANDKHRQKAFDLGASEYLTKPFDDAKLIEKIKNLVA